MRTILAISLFFPLTTAAASFDCTKATSNNEKLICNSPTLSSLDEQLSAKYKIALNDGDDALRADQQKWIKSTNKTCLSEACLSDAYKQRINVLDSWRVEVPSDNTMIGNFDVKHPVFVVNNEKTDGYEKISVHDCLSISKINSTTIKFNINSVGANAHICSISGTATLKNGVYYYDKSSDTTDDDSNCNLTIINRKNLILIRDPDNGCREFSCGMRAGLDGLTYSKNMTTTHSCDSEY